MMSDKDQVLVQHIHDSISAVFDFIKDIDLPQFLENDLVASAVIKKFEVIGEASNRLSLEFKSAHPSIPWQDIIGMRNILIHDYMGVDLESVWQTIHQDLVMLRENLSDFDSSEELSAEMVEIIERSKAEAKRGKLRPLSDLLEK